MKKMHTEKTATFSAFDTNNNEYQVTEFTHFSDIQLPHKPPKKIEVARSYKTETGEHVQKQDDSNFVILTGYGQKNIPIHTNGIIKRFRSKRR
jgi:hypothetical protein